MGIMKNLIYIVLSSTLAAMANAAPIIIDGSGSTTGINNGFGDVYGNTSTLSIDSTLSGDITFTATKGISNINDTAVIYIDNDNGASGITNTFELTDTGDGGRMAISGMSHIGLSNLGFAPGFAANYAITIEVGFSGLFEIASSPNNLNFVSENCCAPIYSNTPIFYLSFNLADIGLSAGDSFDYFLTYLNSSNAFRSNEFNGVSAATVGGIPNPSRMDFNLAEDDYVHFTSVSAVPVPTGLLLMLSGIMGFLPFFRNRKCD